MNHQLSEPQKPIRTGSTLLDSILACLHVDTMVPAVQCTKSVQTFAIEQLGRYGYRMRPGRRHRCQTHGDYSVIRSLDAGEEGCLFCMGKFGQVFRACVLWSTDAANPIHVPLLRWLGPMDPYWRERYMGDRGSATHNLVQYFEAPAVVARRGGTVAGPLQICLGDYVALGCHRLKLPFWEKKNVHTNSLTRETLEALRKAGAVPPAPEPSVKEMVDALAFFFPARPAETEVEEPAGVDLSDAKNLNDIIGNAPALALIRAQIAGARARGEAFPHCLLVGPPGTGKTTIARAIAKSMGSRLFLQFGDDASRDNIVPVIRGLRANDIIFIDELQASPVATLLLSAMQDRQVTIDGVTTSLPPFTLIAATTNPARISRPLRQRFELIRLGYYTTADLQQVVLDEAARVGLATDQRSALYIAQYSGGTPRRALKILMGARDFSRDGLTVDVDAVQDYYLCIGLDQWGLDAYARGYLQALDTLGGRAGLNTIASALNDAAEEVREAEGALLSLGMIGLSGRGRFITGTGREVLDSRARDRDAGDLSCTQR